MRNKETKYFADIQTGKLNSDDADFVVGTNEWVNAENVRSLTTDKGVTGTIESIGSTILRSTPEPSVTHIQIGSAIDIANSRILYFLYDIHGNQHKIKAYYPIGQQEYVVVLASQITGGLTFDKYSPIFSAKVNNGILLWTDNFNQPRKINIDAGIKLNNPSFVTSQLPYTNPIESTVITIVRTSFGIPVYFTKSTTGTTINLIKTFSGQFAVRYIFRDGEVSVLNLPSTLVPYNYETETFDTVTVFFSIQEKIPQDVQVVDLCLRYGNSGNYYVIKSWNKAIASQAAEIAAHNIGTALSYVFLNTQVGITLDNAYSVKPFDRVPLLSKTLETELDRLFLANNLLGYDTPTTTSLTATPVSSGLPGTSYNWYLFRIDFTYMIGGSGPFTATWYRYLAWINDAPTNPGFYTYVGTPQPPPPGSTVPPFTPPASIAYGALVFYQGTSANVFNQLQVEAIANHSATSFTLTNTLSTVIGVSTVTGVTGGAPNNINVFKSFAPYRLGVVFRDKYKRKCGVVTSDNSKVITADRNYPFSPYTTGILWGLSNTNSLIEIPIWAYYYDIVITKNLRTRYFLQAKCRNIQYATKNANGTFTYSSTYAATAFGVAVDISLLDSFGMGYLFEEGSNDIMRLYFFGVAAVNSLPVLAQDGNYVIAQLADVGTVNAQTQALFEIYTPYLASLQEPYYTVGQSYMVSDPGTLSRQYGSVIGIINGDTYAFTRTASGTCINEAMSPNDKFYKVWLGNWGEPNIVTLLGQVRNKNSIVWSNTYIPGTQTNGLSSFDALDERILSQETGQIQKLQITSKVENELGIVMLAICEKETVSMYMGEVQLYGSNASATLAQAPNVIGTINVLKGSYGTLNPESITEYRGNVYWLDAGNGRYVQYSGNGLFPISNYKMTRFWKLFSAQYLSMTAVQIEALGGRPFVFSTVDPAHNELVISIPKLLNVPPKGFLPDYPATIYPFDIWDGQGKTIVYKLDLGIGNPHWQGAYSFNPEGFVSFLNMLFSFKNGFLYEHNQTTSYNQFYGVFYKSRIMFVSNQEPTIPKVYNAISVQSNLKPNLSYFYNDYPYQQASDLVDFDPNWGVLEGLFYASLYRNKLIPTASGYLTNGLLTAEYMRATALKIMLEFSVNEVPLELKFISMIYSQSRGHNNA